MGERKEISDGRAASGGKRAPEAGWRRPRPPRRDQRLRPGSTLFTNFVEKEVLGSSSLCANNAHPTGNTPPLGEVLPLTRCYAALVDRRGEEVSLWRRCTHPRTNYPQRRWRLPVANDPVRELLRPLRVDTGGLRRRGVSQGA